MTRALGLGIGLVLGLGGCAEPELGSIRAQRLNRVHYANSIRDLTGVAPALLDQLPADERGLGFDTMAELLTVSPLLLELLETITDEAVAEALAPEGPLREQLVPCDADAIGGRACAREVLAGFVPRAWRRPITAAEEAALLELYDAGEGLGLGFDGAIALVLRSVLLSPNFLFRIERRASAGEGAAARLDGVELAARLSYFLWSTTPDERLMDAALAGELDDAAGLEAEVRRMLADPRAAALTDDFAGQWLLHRAVDDLFKDVTRFPAFDAALQRSMKGEQARFFASFVAEDRDLRELLLATDSFVDARLAALYGLPDPGAGFVRVDLGDAPRRGILTQAGLLSALAHPFRTAPALRGRWVLENLLCEPVASPPPGVDAPLLDEGATQRERFELHRADPACRGCHAAIDPIGLAFESYDAIGRHRTEEGGVAIDPSGELPSGVAFSGAPELAALIADDPAFVRCATTKALTYALGRGLDEDDEAHVDAITEELAARGYGLRELFVLVATSEPFVSRHPEGT